MKYVWRIQLCNVDKSLTWSALEIVHRVEGEIWNRSRIVGCKWNVVCETRIYSCQRQRMAQRHPYSQLWFVRKQVMCFFRQNTTMIHEIDYSSWKSSKITESRLTPLSPLFRCSFVQKNSDLSDFVDCRYRQLHSTRCFCESTFERFDESSSDSQLQIRKQRCREHTMW